MIQTFKITSVIVYSGQQMLFHIIFIMTEVE